MDSYLDVTILKDQEFPVPQLLSVLYSKLHTALVAQQTTRIGVSFPGMSASPPSLGNRMRLHGTEADLHDLMKVAWLSGMRDHIAVSDMESVPADAKHRRVKRIQVKSNAERLRRRLMRRHGLDETQARERIPDSAARHLKLPFLHLNSTSTGQRFRLFLEHGPVQDIPRPGVFNAYGLSNTATVPWF